MLSRLPEPFEAQKVILERQGAVDVEREEGDIVGEFVQHQLEQLRYDADREMVFVPSTVAAMWFNWATGDKARSTIAACRALKQFCDEGRIPCLKPSPSRQHGRGFVWYGEHVDVTDNQIKFDLQQRLKSAKDAAA